MLNSHSINIHEAPITCWGHRSEQNGQMPLPSWSLNTDVDYRLIYKFNVIEIKISTGFFKLDKVIPKST